MDFLDRETVAAIVVGAFGLFLVWKGTVGRVVRLSSGKAIFPKWMYLLSGILVLILPVAYLVLRVMGN